MKRKKEAPALAAAFVLPVLLMLVLFIIRKIYPFGGRSFLTGDLYHQYLPFLSEFAARIRGGQGMDFSYNLGIGSNYMALYVYYLASPFHYLALLLPKENLIDFVAYIVVLKTGLCSLTACKYFREHFQTDSPATILFGIMYSFSGFMAAYSYNIMWLDCIWLLPLVLLGAERLVKEGRFGLYCVALGFSIYTNYYLSIMICIYLVLYFAVLFVTNKGRRLKSIVLFGVSSLLAGAMAGVLLVPEVCAILQTDFGDVEFPTKIESYFSVLDMLARHGMCVFTERGLDHWPNIYCGVAVLMLIPMYLLNRRISIREKFCRMALAGFMLLSFSTNILDFVWHGCNYPDSLPARQSFLYIFLVLTMCYDAFKSCEEDDRQHILYGYLAAVGFFLFSEKFIDHEDFELGVKLLTLVFVTVYAIILYLWHTRREKFTRGCIAVFAFAVVLAECGLNMGDTAISTVSRKDYIETLKDYEALYEQTKSKEEGVYRLEKFERKTKNDGTMAGFPTASIFSSTLNSQVMDMYTLLGMRHSKVYYAFDGATSFTSALLNVNYMFAEKDGYENSLYTLEDTSGKVRLYACNYTLPFGYVAPFGYDIPEGFKNQAMSLQNEMVKNLGVEGTLYKKITKKSSVETMEFTASEDGVYYGLVTASGTKKLKITGDLTAEFSDLKINGIIYIGELAAGQTVTIKNGDDKDTTPNFSLEIYRQNEDVLAEVIEALGAVHLEHVTYTDSTINGELSLEQAGRLIVSVPYEDGWTVTVNGSELKGEKFGGALAAFDLEAGVYSIGMKYVPVGKRAGLLLTIAGVVIFTGLFVLDIKLRKKAAKKAEQKRRIEEMKAAKEGRPVQTTAAESSEAPAENGSNTEGEEEMVMVDINVDGKED